MTNISGFEQMQESRLIERSGDCTEFDSILGIVFEYVIQVQIPGKPTPWTLRPCGFFSNSSLWSQQREKPSNAGEATAPDLRHLLDANLVPTLSEVYRIVFAQLRTVGVALEPRLISLFKTLLCIFEEYAPGYDTSICAQQSIKADFCSKDSQKGFRSSLPTANFRRLVFSRPFRIPCSHLSRNRG